MDSFAKKATNTLRRRASSLWILVHWLRVHYSDPMPITEERVYEFAKWCARERRPATRVEGVVEAIGFARGVIGLENVDDTVASGRIRGSGHKQYMTKRQTRQAAALTRRMVGCLEQLAINGSGPDQVLAGDACFCIHTRARYSDAANIAQEPFLDISVGENGEQFGFVEATADRVKTSGAKRKRRVPIPLVGMAIGFQDAPWAEEWLAARMRHGLAADADGCLFRAVGKDGSFAQRRRSSSDMGLWVREALIKYGGYSPEDVQFITSHSLKDTQLCWLAKACVKHGIRRLLLSLIHI